MTRIIILFLTTVAMFANDSQPGGFLGIAGLQHSRVQMDFAVPFVRVSASSSGMHLGFAYKQNKDMDVRPVGKTQEYSHRGYQIGYFADLGRGTFTIGYERSETVTQTNYLNQDGFPLTRDETEKKSGAYGKVGLRGEIFGVYVGYGTASKFTAGISVHF